MRKLEYDIKRLARAILRHTRDVFATANGVPRYIVKWKTLDEFFNPDNVLIETGTYLGESTYHFSKKYPKVISFEPLEELADYNKKRFDKISNIEIVNSESESGLENTLNDITGSINFWLDGHFSGEGTFGQQEFASPIFTELKIILEWAKNRENSKVMIAVDDARLFTGSNGYLSIHEISAICREFHYQLRVKNDIFLISKQDTN